MDKMTLIALALVAQTMIPSFMICSRDEDMSRALRGRGVGTLILLVTVGVITMWYLPSNVLRAIMLGALIPPLFEIGDGAVDRWMNS